MTDKYIGQYIESTTPSSTDKVLLDTGSGVYKYTKVSNLTGKLNDNWRLRPDGNTLIFEYSTDGFVTSIIAQTFIAE